MLVVGTHGISSCNKYNNNNYHFFVFLFIWRFVTYFPGENSLEIPPKIPLGKLKISRGILGN